MMSLIFTSFGGGLGISYQLGRAVGCPPSGKLPPTGGPGGIDSCAATMRLLYKLELGPSSAIEVAVTAIVIPASAIFHCDRFIVVLRIPHSASGNRPLARIRNPQSAIAYCVTSTICGPF